MTEVERRTWNLFAMALDAELSRCDRMFNVGPGFSYSRAFSLSCFACPDGALVQALGDKATSNAPRPLVNCYDKVTGDLVEKYMFSLPPGVSVLDNHFSRVSGVPEATAAVDK